MKNGTHRRISGALATALLLCACIVSNAQNKDASQRLPELSAPAEHSIEELNYLGGDAAKVPFSDSVIDINSRSCQAILCKGLAFRVITGPQCTQNILAAPVPADDQVYVGQLWRVGTTITGSRSLRVSPGNCVCLGLS
jgi:hypothetical protein